MYICTCTCTYVHTQCGVTNNALAHEFTELAKEMVLTDGDGELCHVEEEEEHGHEEEEHGHEEEEHGHEEEEHGHEEEEHGGFMVSTLRLDKD